MDESKLTIKKEKAIELVMAGMTDGMVAEMVGVSRQVINTWRNHDDDFMDALAMRRTAMREQHQDRLNELVTEAIETLAEALHATDEKMRVQAAVYVLKLAGLGKTDPVKSREETEKGMILKAVMQVSQEMGIGRVLG